MQSRTLSAELRELLATSEPAQLGPERRDGTSSVGEIDARLKQVNLLPAVRDLLRATIYLWHDHLDESHQIAQDIGSADGSLVHAIMHRREPDYWNSKYWFRRVGHHTSFLTVAGRAGELLEKAGETDLLSRLLPNKTWDPFAFVDAVEDVEKGKFKSKTEILRAVQRIEFESLVENLMHRPG